MKPVLSPYICFFETGSGIAAYFIAKWCGHVFIASILESCLCWREEWSHCYFRDVCNLWRLCMGARDVVIEIVWSWTALVMFKDTDTITVGFLSTERSERCLVALREMLTRRMEGSWRHYLHLKLRNQCMMITHGLWDCHFGSWQQAPETWFPSELKDAEV